MAFNFKGGIHIDDKKSSTKKKPIEEMNPAETIIMPLIQHNGEICDPIVGIGDYVKIGQPIAESKETFGVTIHSSVSGTVRAIAKLPVKDGSEVLSVVIENDFEDVECEPRLAQENFQTIDAETLAYIVKEAGIVGLSGSATPTANKIKAAENRAHTLIVNGAECEPYVNSDNRMMIEYTEQVYDGAMIVARALEIENTVIVIQSNKPHAVNEMRQYLFRKTGMKLRVMHTKYPLGAERQLVHAVTGKEVPPLKSAIDVGVITLNVSTVIAISRAVREGKPLTTRVVTVAGSAVANPKNLLVRIGTPIKELFDACGGFLEHPEKIVVGGPMMGYAQIDENVPVTKDVNCVLAFSKGEGKTAAPSACIRCGKCVSACPMNLMPLYIYEESRRGELENCKKLNVVDCTECGCCSYVCPARKELTKTISAVKNRILGNDSEAPVEKEVFEYEDR